MVWSSTPGVLQTTMPELGGRRHVDVVVADGDVADDPEPSGRPGSEHLGVDAVREEADHRIDLACGCGELVGAHGAVLGGLDDLVTSALEGREGALGQVAGDEDAGHFGDGDRWQAGGRSLGRAAISGWCSRWALHP